MGAVSGGTGVPEVSGVSVGAGSVAIGSVGAGSVAVGSVAAGSVAVDSVGAGSAGGAEGFFLQPPTAKSSAAQQANIISILAYFRLDIMVSSKKSARIVKSPTRLSYGSYSKVIPTCLQGIFCGQKFVV